MSASSDIARTWRGPRRVYRDLLGHGVREDRVLAYLMVGCLVVFIAQWPIHVRVAQGFGIPEGAEVPSLQRLLTYGFFGWLMLAPLMFYVIALIAHAIARLLGGHGPGYNGRLSIFWALLASSPAALLYGLAAGFIGPAPGTEMAGLLWLGAFVYFSYQGLRETYGRSTRTA